VLEQRDQAPAAAGEAHVQDRAHEAPAAQAEPAARDLKTVSRGPFEALDFEVHAGSGRGRALRWVLCRHREDGGAVGRGAAAGE
jgi:hypothetical protein